MAEGAIRVAPASDVTNRMPRRRESPLIAATDAMDSLDLDLSRLPYDDGPSGHRPAVDQKVQLNQILRNLFEGCRDGLRCILGQKIMEGHGIDVGRPRELVGPFDASGRA